MMPFFDDDEFFGDLLLMGAAGGGKAVEATATGNPLTFVTDLGRPLKSLLIPFTPVQSGTGDPSPSNIRPIVPWDGLKVFGGGKNLFNGTNVINGYFSARESDTIIYSASAGRTVWCPCKPDAVYAVSKMTGGKRLGVYVSEEEPKVNTVVYSTQRISGSGTDTYVFRTPSNAKYICVFVWLSTADTEITAEEMIASVQIEAGNTATAYEPYHPITETDISFPSPVFGGTLDVVSGVLTVEWAGFSATWGDGESSTDMGSGIIRKVFPMVDYLSTGLANNVCNIAQYSANESANVHFYYSGSGATNRKCRLFLPSDTPDTTVVTVVTKLSQTYEVQLTPTQITALVGNNTIWSDADGSMTAVYLKKG